MNREIKFRVWNLQDKCWDNPAILEVWDESGKLEPYEYIKSGTLNPLYIPKENYIIQQYSGINDKNGNEIYEGDIIKYKNKIGKINFFAGMFLSNWDDQTDDELGYMEIDDVEVIGNIYETS